MEPERKIEKLLRAYAKNRRARAGNSFKLHPATRRLLQGEVARHKPTANDDETSLSLWELFRTNWAALAGFVLIIFFCASFLMPALNKAKNKAKSLQAMSELKQIGVAAQIAAADNHGRLPATLDELTNAMGSSLMLTDVVSGQRFVYVASGEILDNLQTNTILAYSPGNQRGHAVLFADGSVREVRRDKFSALTNGNLPVPTVVATTASQVQKKLPEAKPPASPAAGRPMSAGGRLGSTQTSPGLAAGVGGNSAAQNLIMFKSKLATEAGQSALNKSETFAREAVAAVPPVLESFEVRRSGGNISIVDRDGSIYEGTLLVAKASETTRKELGISRQRSFSPSSYRFHVSGTNQTLNQNVVFAGNLVAVANTNMTTGFYFGTGNSEGTPLKTANSLSAQEFSNLRITGTITLDDTNRIEIIAVPSTQQ